MLEIFLVLFSVFVRYKVTINQNVSCTSSSNFFDLFWVFLSSLVTGASFMSISSLVLELWQFPFIRDWPEIRKLEIPPSQFVIFSPWKVPRNWIAIYQNSFVISHGSLYHLIRRDLGRLENEAFTSNPIVSFKQ